MDKRSKKYFIRDDSLHNIDNDKFNYADISTVLDDIIATNEPPYNVAIIGKWGLGKSSLINLVTDKLGKQPNDYLVQDINAWKYEKESLSKVFLKQLWQGVSGQRFSSYEVIRKEFNKLVNSELTTETLPRNDVGLPKKNFGERVKEGFRQIGNWFKSNKALLLTTLAIFFVSIAAFIIYKCVQANLANEPLFTSNFWGYSFLSYCKNIATILLFPVLIALFKTLLDSYHDKESKKVELNFSLENTDDYEIFLESAIKEKLSQNPNYKIVTVIDDLDRLSINKIVEALDALKAFVGFQRCIFIVPFDDEIIKLALEKRRIQQFDDSDVFSVK